MPRKVFTAGEVLAASDVNSFLMDQAVQTYTDSTARASAVSTATAPAGLVTYLDDEDTFEYWDGSQYKTFGGGAPAGNLDFLVVAGGGGGGNSNFNNNAVSGGGGAGGYRSSVVGESSGGGFVAESKLTIITGTNYPVSIGAGGAGGASVGTSGSKGVNSSFFLMTSEGGGFGAGAPELTAVNGGAGGSGGGGATRTSGTSGNGGAGSTAQGFAGGTASGGVNSAAGGGGAGAVGATVTDASGAGGAGVASSITGSSVTRAAGGAGNGDAAGSANTGNGAGGGNDAVRNGGSGVVILKFPDTLAITIGAGLTGSTATSGSFTVATITAGAGNVSWAAA
jgi:hypothetical protein